MKMTTVAVLTSIAVIILVLQMFQVGNLREKITGLATGSIDSIGPLDTSSWTENEIMNYEMHGTIPARFGKNNNAANNAAAAGMVGGC